jgi:uncharacterized protein
MIFGLILLLAATIGGGMAAVTGFGIGSILTPVLAAKLGTKIAVVVVSIPHVAGTLVRFVLIRQHLNRWVLVRFGIASAIGGIAGALLHARFSTAMLSYVLGGLLLFAGLAQFTGMASRMRFGRRVAWIAGIASGVFGGLVGNQGGIRSAALLGFDMEKESFVATATAIGLLVDAARVPIYFASSGVGRNWTYLGVGTAGVIFGTLLGKQLLSTIPGNFFRRVVAVILLALGISLFIRPNP